ncbi:MAG: PQQ-dependent sugar dehydrogenase, partial [Longimicrobiales bacterium]|nr:PQQ-dependent sugar dehydrogenase [Longimicrobiales bacterium]
MLSLLPEPPSLLTARSIAPLLLLVPGAGITAQNPPTVSSRSLPDFPTSVETADQTIRVRTVRGLSHPWSLAFLPNGDILVTERNAGQLRMVREGVLDPRPISGVPTVANPPLGGLMEVVLHPDFAENSLVYLSYTKQVGEETHTAAVARGSLEGTALDRVEELFVANAAFDGPGAGIPMAFDEQGYLYVGVGGGIAGMVLEIPEGEPAQRLDSHAGKILRLRDDGTVPSDNPFVGQEGHLPEIWSYGHRNMVGLTIHPETGEVWESENGPYGGDEVNIIRKGR